MSVGPLVFELILVFCVALILLHHYGRTFKQHPLVTIATLIAWYFSLIIVFILPLDVSSTFYRQCVHNEEKSAAFLDSTGTLTSASITNLSEVSHGISEGASRNFTNTPTHDPVLNPLHNTTVTSYSSIPNLASSIAYSVTPEPQSSALSNSTYGNGAPVTGMEACLKPWSYVPDNTLPAMWHVVYWTSQLLTWLILPFMQSYACAGDFSTWGKIKRAVIENAVYYGSYLLLFGALLIYVAATPSISLNIAQLKVILITASNTWGLFLLVLLLGYGLVEVPRRAWHAADLDRSQAQTYFKLAKLTTEKQEAKEDLDDVLQEIERVSSTVQYNHPLRKHVNVIISKCPDEFQSRVSQGMDDYEDYDHGQGRSDVPSETSLVRLHRKVIRSTHTQVRTKTQWKIAMRRCLHLENVAKNITKSDRKWKEEFPNLDERKSYINQCCNPSMQWFWYCRAQAYLKKALAVCLAVFSLFVVWSECTFFNKHPVLSLFAIFINLALSSYNYFCIELASFLTISYLCVCAYYTVFRIKFFNYYYIAGHHQTDESSLLFVGIMLCRLTAPLCLNFLGMIHLDTHITGEPGVVETAYTRIMGHLDVISFISDGFNIYFPILVCVLCTATYFNLGQRCLSAIGFQRFIDAADDMTNDLVVEGKQLVSREKRSLQQKMRSLQRAEWQNEFGTTGDVTSRQWKGRAMQNAERRIDTTDTPVRFNKKKTDKVELLEDVGPIDYNSVADTADESGADILWEKPSRWSSSSYQSRSGMSSRPPKNLFDDV